MSSTSVRQFTVTEDLLRTTQGLPNLEAIRACYRIKSLLVTHYQQWRIAATPWDIKVKAQTPDGETVLDTVLPMAEEPGEEDMQWYEELERLIAFMYQTVNA